MEVQPQRVARDVLHVVGLEQEAEAVVEAVDGEDDRDPERPEDLDVDAELRHVAHDPGAGDVQRRLDRQQDQRDQQDRRVVGRVQVPAEPVVRQRGDVADDAGVDGGDGDQQREAVEPADEPAVAWADGELAVLEQRAGDRVVAGELAEHERDEEHPDHGEPRQPDVRRSARAHAEHEQRVDPDHRRQIGERDGEVREQPEHAVQLRLVAQAFEPRVLALVRARRLDRRLAHRSSRRRLPKIRI